MGGILRIGEWINYKGERKLVFDVRKSIHDQTFVHFTSKFGLTDYTDATSELLEHLPDCRGWDWQPFAIREGAYYELKNGDVVGPLSLSGSKWVTSIEPGQSGKWWHANGQSQTPEWSIVREVPAPQPEPRPFANAEEYRPHRDRWIKRVDGEGCWKPAGYSNEGIHVDEKRVTSYEALFEKFTFEDGSKCGVDPDIPF